MNSLKGKRIIIFQQRLWAKRIGHFLAKKLQDEGCSLAALTFKRTTHDFILSQNDVKYNLIINNDEVMSRPKDYLAGETIPLSKICEDLGIDSIWPFVATLRNHVRSYKDKYYYSFKQNMPDEEIADYIMAVYKYIKVFFDNFNPDIIIAPNFVALPHIMFYLYAKKRGIKMFDITDCKIKDIYIFSYSYCDDEGPFYDRVDELNEKKADSENKERARKYIKEFRENFKVPADMELHLKSLSNKKPLIQKIKGELSPYKQILKWYLKEQKNVLESTGISIDYRPPRIILRDHYCRKKYQKFADNYPYYKLDKISKYIYFPLQFQPEATIDVLAPFFNNQIETARQVALAMPGDYTLVVKEHPSMIGLRPSSYLEKVARTVNVKLIDYRIPSEKVIKGADLIISPSSTTIVEAAFLNKPAIQLGNLGTTLKLPNIIKHTDMTKLSPKIKEVVRMDLNNEEYERRLENYVAAAFDTGLNLDYTGAWEGGGGGNLDQLLEYYKDEVTKLLS